jgi:CCR4-NOT transcription complex subunit 4
LTSINFFNWIVDHVFISDILCAYKELAFSGTSRSKNPAPPGFSVPARVPPPGFSSGFPSQDGLNPPPGFSSGIASRDGSNPASRFPSGISLQDGSNPPSRFPSTFSSGLPSQDGLGSPSRFSSAFSPGFQSQDGFNSCSRFHPSVSSGFSLKDGSNPPSRFPSAFSSGFSSQDGSNQVYGSAYSGLFTISRKFVAHPKQVYFLIFLRCFAETHIQDSLLGGSTNHYEHQLARHTRDIEFVDPAILAVGKGRMPGIGNPGLEMKTTPAFPAQLQTSNNDQRIQLLMQQNMQPHQRTHIQDAFNTMNDNYLASRLLGQNQGSLSPYAQMPPQQPRSSHLTNGHLHAWSDLRQGSNTNTPMSDMSGILYPSEANNLHMMGSNDLYNRAFGM